MVLYPVNTFRTLKVEILPRLVHQGEKHVFRLKIPILRRGWFVREIWIFHGRDFGDEAEMDSNVWDGTTPLALRSDHDLLRYQAWTNYRVEREVKMGMSISLVARANGRNLNLDRDEIRPHWGIYINWSASWRDLCARATESRR